MSAASETEVAESEQRRSKQRQNLNRLWPLFWALAKPFFLFEQGAKLNFLWVIFLLLLRSGFVVVFSFLSRDFWTALQHKDTESFWKLIRLFTLLLLCALPTLVWCDYSQQRLSLRWRKWYTQRIIYDYFSYRNYYQIDSEKSIDNPDQRISQDIDSFTITSLSFFLKVFRSLIDLFNFSFILFSIYPQLFVILFIYSLSGTVIAIFLGKRLIHLNFRQLKLEADFRYSLIRIRENSESIAFYNGEKKEKSYCLNTFYEAFLNRIHLIIWSRNLAFFTESYSYLVEILPLALIAPLYFQGSIEMGVVSQASQAFRHILSDLSIIVDEFDRISAFSAGIDRLGDLEHFIYKRFGDIQDSNSEQLKGDHDEDDDASAILYGRQYTIDAFRDLRRRGVIYIDNENTTDTDRDSIDEEKRKISDKDEELGDISQETVAITQIETKVLPLLEETLYVQLENLTLATPAFIRRILFEDISFKLESDTSLLIVGPSGTGKSSLLRAIAGLWTNGSGSITRPELSSIFFLPQKPYCTLGTLREQLLYPRTLDQVTDSSYTDADLINAMRDVNLSELPSRMGGLDTTLDWSNILSLGEQQRLAFARLLINRPKVAILDECSSALDVPTEQRLYSKLRAIGISFISVGHRPTLLQYHDFILRLGGDLGKSFVFERIQDPSTQEM